MTLIMDRGFCSKKNILDMHESKYRFVQPLSLSLKLAKNLIEKYFRIIQSPEHMFAYKDKAMYHILDSINLSGVEFDAHIFFNDEKALAFKNDIWCAVLREAEAMDKVFTSEKEAKLYIEDNMISRLCPYFKFDAKSGKLVKDDIVLQRHYIKSGLIIMASNISNMKSEDILDLYKNRNIVEEGICVFKNSLDGGRLRAHSNKTAEGRIFIKFLAMIINARMKQTIKSNKLLKKYSIKQILLELKKLKVNTFDNSSPFVNEISKTQK